MKPLMPLFLLCLLCLGAFQSRADTLVLTPGERPLATKGWLDRLNDPAGILTPEQAAAADGWRRLPSSLSAGYTKDVIWLRLAMTAPTDLSFGWVLRLSNALLDDVRLYQRDGEGNWLELRAGENVDRDDWPMDYRSAVFPLRLEPGASSVVLLRLETKNAMSVMVDVAPRLVFGEVSRHEFLFFGLYFGIYLMLITFHTVFWRMTQAPESGWYLAYVSCCVLIESLTVGLPQEFLGLPVAFSDSLLGVAMALSTPLGITFAGRQLGLHEVYPTLLRRLVLGGWVIGGSAALLVLSGHYRDALPIVQITALALIPMFILLALWLLGRGHRPARFYLLAFGIYYAGVIVAFLRNLGYLPANPWTDNAATFGTMIHMGLMSLRIISHYNSLKRDKERAQNLAQALTQQQNAHLESLVAVRTQRMSEEIGRRTQLEQELRLALEQEQRIRAEQSDFVAMVSHEFRTPLAIISTSAQQLARHLEAPRDKSLQRCQNIRDAGSRMLAMVDNYLTHDRMAEVQPNARFTSCDLEVLWGGLVAEFPSERLAFDYRLPASAHLCDAGLLYVAVRNLLANAQRHAAPGSVISLRVEEAGESVLLSIRHPGASIPEEERERLFHKYYRGSQAQSSVGAGLGLYMVRRIAQLHGGDVKLVAFGGEEDICFHLTLRLAAAVEETTGSAPPMPA